MNGNISVYVDYEIMT